MHSEKKRWGFGFVAAMGLALTLMPGGSGCGTLETEDPPLVRFDEPGPNEEVAPNQYIFAYQEGATESDISATEKLFADLGGVKHHDFQPFFKGFSGELPPNGLHVMLRNPALSSIHPNGVVHATGLQTCPSWGLDVIDQANPVEPNDVYTYASAGTGVHVYVLDSGIQKEHDDFARADGTSRVGIGQCKLANGCANPDDWKDCQGHGTHLAGVAGGKTYGVAKDVTLHAVRVLKCDANCGEPSGLEADVLAGLAWIDAQIQANPGQKAVVVMGFSRPAQGWTTVYDELNKAGLPFAVVAAAGNDGGNACQNMPGGRPNGAMVAKTVLTVGAFDTDGNVAPFSNQGKCVDVFAPGTGIPGPLSPVCSAKPVDIRWGTSAAAAHAAGVAALMLEGGVPATGIRSAVIAQAQPYALGNLNGNSPGLVLHAPSTNAQITSPQSVSPTPVDADGCNDGALCFGGSCMLCDALPAQCGGMTKGGGVTCNALGECDFCGDEGLACCPGASGDFCASGFSCVGGTCTCGGPGQACCGGVGGLCDDPFECDPNGFCGSCGATGQPCCADNTCAEGNACNNGTCQKCGGPGESCCPDFTCSGDMVCDTKPGGTSTCTATCMARCNNGKLATPSGQSFVTEYDCLQWATRACEGQGWYTRVVFNGLYIEELGENCGAGGEACCLSTPNCYGSRTCQHDPDFKAEDIFFNGAKIGRFVGQSNCRLPPP